MKAWDLEKNKVYACNNIKYFIDNEGCLHYKKVLEQNGCESWFICKLTFNEIKNMNFEETKHPIL